MPNRPERDLQRTCNRYFKDAYPHVRMQAGGAGACYQTPDENGCFSKIAKRAGAIRARILKKDGVSNGFPDLFIYHPGAHGRMGLAIELKIGRGRLSEAQEAWADYLTQCGYDFVVVRTIEQFRAAVDDYLS